MGSYIIARWQTQPLRPKQQGSKLVGTGAVPTPVQQGSSVALSANTALVGGFEDNGGKGAAWVFTRRLGGWTQQGSKLAGNLVGTGLAGRGPPCQ